MGPKPSIMASGLPSSPVQPAAAMRSSRFHRLPAVMQMNAPAELPEMTIFLGSTPHSAAWSRRILMQRIRSTVTCGKR